MYLNILYYWKIILSFLKIKFLFQRESILFLNIDFFNFITTNIVKFLISLLYKDISLVFFSIYFSNYKLIHLHYYIILYLFLFKEKEIFLYLSIYQGYKEI